MELYIVSGYVSMNINRTSNVKMGTPNGGRSGFAKFAKVTSTPGFGYISNGGSLVLLLEQTGCQVNIVGGDLPDAEGRQNGVPVQEAEQPVGGLVIQLLSRIGVNVAHHEQDVALLQIVKGRALWKDAADKLMCDLTAALLVGTLRIAVENSASHFAQFGALNGNGVSKLTASVSQYNWEQAAILFGSQRLIQPFKNLCDRPCGIPIS